MKNILSLTLVMMAVMVYTKPINGTLEKINEIIDAVEKLRKELPKYGTIMVSEISTPGDSPCVKELFCLAEKALNETTVAQNLTRVFQPYNKIEHGHGHNCTHNPNPKYPLETFLENFKLCLQILKEGM